MSPHPSARPDRSAHRARRSQLFRMHLWRWRLVATCLALGAATAATVAAVRPPAPPTRPAVALARDTAPGEQLSLTLARIPSHLGPACAVTTTAEIADDTLVVALPAGTILCPTMLSSSPAHALAPEGTVVVPVTLTDPAVAGALQPGDRVNLVRGRGADGDDSRTRIVARGAVVLPARTGAAASDGGGLLGVGASGNAHAATVLVAVQPDEGVAIVDASVSGYVGAVIVQ